MKQFLFTYGTLSNGEAPDEVASLMDSLKPLGEGYIHARLYDLGDYPGAVLSPSARNKVYGRVFELPPDPDVLKEIDRYEEFSPRKKEASLFVRQRVPVRLKNGQEVKCWTYVYNRARPRSPRITSGDYSDIRS